jgi:hypothetical protein
MVVDEHLLSTFSASELWRAERVGTTCFRVILRDALQRSLGEGRIDDIKAEVNRRIERGEFVDVQHESGTPGRSFTTPAMMQLEQDTIDSMRAGQGQHSEVVAERTRDAIARDFGHLNQSQRTAVQEILSSRDQVTALKGAAGTGKTTALAAVRDAAEREGYQVEGFAPAPRAAGAWRSDVDRDEHQTTAIRLGFEGLAPWHEARRRRRPT